MFFEPVSATSRVTRSRIFDREQKLLAQGQAHRERLFRFYTSDKGHAQLTTIRVHHLGHISPRKTLRSLRDG